MHRGERVARQHAAPVPDDVAVVVVARRLDQDDGQHARIRTGRHDGLQPSPHGAGWGLNVNSTFRVSPSAMGTVCCCVPNLSCQASTTHSPAGSPRSANAPSPHTLWWTELLATTMTAFVEAWIS